MPKYLRASRWILFSIAGSDSDDIRQHLKLTKCIGAQWITIDSVIKGYIYFKQPMPIPSRKRWIPCSELITSTKADIMALFSSYSGAAFNNYGSGIIFEPDYDPTPKPISVPFLSIADAIDALYNKYHTPRLAICAPVLIEEMPSNID